MLMPSLIVTALTVSRVRVYDWGKLVVGVVSIKDPFPISRIEYHTKLFKCCIFYSYAIPIL